MFSIHFVCLNCHFSMKFFNEGSFSFLLIFFFHLFCVLTFERFRLVSVLPFVHRADSVKSCSSWGLCFVEVGIPEFFFVLGLFYFFTTLLSQELDLAGPIEGNFSSVRESQKRMASGRFLHYEGKDAENLKRL